MPPLWWWFFFIRPYLRVLNTCDYLGRRQSPVLLRQRVVTGSIRALNLVSTFPDLLNWRSAPAPVAGTARIS